MRIPALVSFATHVTVSVPGPGRTCGSREEWAGERAGRDGGRPSIVDSPGRGGGQPSARQAVSPARRSRHREKLGGQEGISMTLAMVAPRALAAGTPTIWVLSCLAFVCIGLAVIVMKNPTLLGTGQDAAGKAMTVGCTMFLLTGGALVLGLIAAVLAWRNDGVT